MVQVFREDIYSGPALAGPLSVLLCLDLLPVSVRAEPFQMDLQMFKDKSKAEGLDSMANNARSKLRLSLDNMRINANNCAINQFQSREAINCQEIINLLAESYPPSQEQSALFLGLQPNLNGASVASWASHTLSFFCRLGCSGGFPSGP